MLGDFSICFGFLFFLYLLGSDLKLVVIGTDIKISSNSCDMLMFLTRFSNAKPLFALANTLLHRYDLEYPYINVICSFIFFFGMHRLAKREPDPYGILVASLPGLDY